MADLVTPHGRIMTHLSGDPEGLASEVTGLKNVASTIDKLSALLNDIHTSASSQSQKVDELRDGAGEAKKALDKAREIYNNTGWALDEYQTQLSVSQTDAKNALNSANDLLPTVTAAESAVNGAVNAHFAATRPVWEIPSAVPETPEEAQREADHINSLGNAVTSANNVLDAHNATLLSYKKKWDTAKDDLDTAARVAKGRIEDAVESNPAKDSWWDNLAAFLSGLSDIIGWIVLVLVIVAIFATGPLALALLAIITVLSVVSLLLEATLLVGGKGGWDRLAFAAIGIIPFGKLFGKGASISTRLARTGKGAIDNLNVIKTIRGVNQARTAMAAAVSKNSISRSGKVWQSWADNAAEVVAGSKTPMSAKTLWETMKAGGSRETARMADILENLTPRNVPAREAINAAKELVDAPSVSLGVYTSITTADSIKSGVENLFNLGNDGWNTNEAVDLFSPDSASGGLKARINDPQYVEGATPTLNPYDPANQ